MHADRSQNSEEEMTRQEMRSVLRRWGKADSRIQELADKLRDLSNEIDTIEGLQAVNMDGMPRSGVGHPTEARALRAMALLEKKEDEVTAILQEMEELDRIKLRVDIALNALTKRQTQIIRELYQVGGTHEKVAERLGIDPRVLRRTEADAIDRLIKELL